MHRLKPRRALALALLAPTALAAAPAVAKTARSQRMETVDFAGRSYRFPASHPGYVKRFGDSFEVGLPFRFWSALLARVAPLRPWQSGRDDGTVLIYVTRPNGTFPWARPKAAGEPPVAEPVVREAERGTMTLWASRGPFGEGDLVYATYRDRPDIYVRCDRVAVDDPASGCDLYWFDEGVLHMLGLVGDWLEHAPAVAFEYERAVRPRQSGRPGRGPRGG